MGGAPEHHPRTALESAETLAGTRAEPESHAAHDATEIPARIGRYLILRRLGQGGMGVVYSAYDADLDRKVAIKVVRDTLQHSSQGRSRVLQEAQAMARIAHPNVVHVYEVGQDAAAVSSQVYIAMEFVPGLSLAEWLRRYRDSASLTDLLRLYLQAAAGLAAAHASGLIHRDFKPDNVLIGEDGRARVVDFGLARARDAAANLPARSDGDDSVPRSSSGARLTEVGAILGTPGYMAPEQVLGEETDARSDQFSFCVALYEALYRQLPFAGDSFEDFSINVLDGKLRPPPPHRADTLEVPILLEQALRRGLSRDPAARFPSIEALIAALSAGLGPDADSQRSRRRKQLVLLLGCGSVMAMSVIRAITAPTLQRGDLRGSMRIGWILVLIAVMLSFALRKQLSRNSVTRRGAYFYVVTMSFVALGRTIAFGLDIPHMKYLVLEQLGLGTVIALEIPTVGKQYLWPLAFCVIGAISMIVAPQYGPIVLNLCLAMTALLTTILRPWSAQIRKELPAPQHAFEPAKSSS